MIYATAQIQADNAAKYILKLCRHFAHKVPAIYTAFEGRVRFVQGPCVMKGSDTSLAIHLQSEAIEGIHAMQYIIDDHLRRFALNETLQYEWTPLAPDETIQRELEAVRQAETLQ